MCDQHHRGWVSTIPVNTYRKPWVDPLRMKSHRGSSTACSGYAYKHAGIFGSLAFRDGLSMTPLNSTHVVAAQGRAEIAAKSCPCGARSGS